MPPVLEGLSAVFLTVWFLNSTAVPRFLDLVNLQDFYFYSDEHERVGVRDPLLQ